MNSPIIYAVEDKDLDDAALWAVIDSAAAASLSSTTAEVKHRKIIPVRHSPSVKPPAAFSSPSPQSRLPRTPKNPSRCPQRLQSDGEVLQEPWDTENQRPQKLARFNTMSVSEVTEASSPSLMMVKHVQRSPVYSSPETSKRFQLGEHHRNNGSCNSPIECSPVTVSRDQFEESGSSMRHSLSGRFPSVSLFKEYQNAAMAILEKTDFTVISGSPFIKKSGWRKISCYFNISYEIKDKSIEFDDQRNVLRAEFIVRAFMQGGRFSDGWGSCERREKRFIKPNHDIPSTAETRAKNKACQDLLGIGEYRPGGAHS